MKIKIVPSKWRQSRQRSQWPKLYSEFWEILKIAILIKNYFPSGVRKERWILRRLFIKKTVKMRKFGSLISLLVFTCISYKQHHYIF